MRKTRLFAIDESWLAWPPLQSLAATKKLLFVQIFGGEKLLEKCRSNTFERPERGITFFRTRFGSLFSDLFFRVFQTVFVSNCNFSGAVSFCRRAALRIGCTPRGHAKIRFLEGLLEGSLQEVLLRRVPRRRLVRVSPPFRNYYVINSQ